MKSMLLKLIQLCTLCLVCASAFCAASAAEGATESPIPVDQRRGVEQTFLTFPEWYLVHSPAEYASYVADHPSHGFPFLTHIEQLWSSYAAVTEEQVRENYPMNFGYHVMICVIASSTTVEYAIRSAYENTLGRISWSTSSGLTEEDRYGAVVAQDYVDFIRQQPWYLYNFSAKLKGLWTTTPAFGPNMLRKWERRYALTTEYVIKAVYGKLIEWATHAAYDPALMTTQVVVDHAPAALPAGVTAKVVRELPDGRAVMDLPRYFDFRIAATALASQGTKLVDIAGNTSVILVTVWVTDDTASAMKQGNRVLFEQPLVTMPGKRRVALIVPVSDLSALLLRARDQNVKVEHVYDY
jgi:hypothetical protein